MRSAGQPRRRTSTTRPVGWTSRCEAGRLVARSEVRGFPRAQQRWGITDDPGGTSFNPVRNLPALDGVPTRDPASRSRIIGEVRLPDRVSAGRAGLSSLRADEGEPFVVGGIDFM